MFRFMTLPQTSRPTTLIRPRRARNTLRLRDRIDAETRNAIALDTTMKTLSRAGNKLSKLAVTLDILWLHEVGSTLNELAHELSQRHAHTDADIIGGVSRTPR